MRTKYSKGIIFLIGMFCLGLITVFPYGAHLDQRSEQEIMYSNIKTCLRYFGGTETSFYGRLDAAGIPEITDSIEKDHGMAVYYPIFWIFYLNQNSPFIGNIVWHTYIFCVIFYGYAVFFKLLWEMFGSFKTAALTTSMLFFTPRLFAESHYNNKDMALLSLTLCVFFFGWKILRERAWRYVIGFALAAGLAANMKIIGIMIWGLIGLYILFALLCTRQFNKKMAVKMVVCVVLTLAFYVVMTPACWSGIWEFFWYLIESAKNFRWNDYVLFAGEMYNKNTTGMPKAYLLRMMFLTVPVGILALALGGLIKIVCTLIRKPAVFLGETGYAAAIILAGMIPLGYAAIMETPVYNGWRHFYFCYGSVIMMAAYGIILLREGIGKWGKRIYADFLLVGYLLLLAGGILANYPHEYAYYNFFVGSDIEGRYELDYWDMSFKEAYRLILQDNAGETVKIGTITNPAYWGLESQLYAIRGKWRMRVVLCENWQDAQYLIVNPTYAYMYGIGDYNWIKENYILMDSVCSYGNVICEIYQK